jgi:ElaB/YqjD/DUF883 family membrane-anchored ribosome-binding protein
MDNINQGKGDRDQHKTFDVNDNIEHEENRATTMETNPDYDVTLSGMPNSVASQATRESDIQSQTHPGVYNEPALSQNLYETDGSGGEASTYSELGGDRYGPGGAMRGQVGARMQQAKHQMRQATHQVRHAARRAGGYMRSKPTATTLVSVGLVAATGYLIARSMSRRSVSRRSLADMISMRGVGGSSLGRTVSGGKGYLKGLAAGRSMGGSLQDSFGNMRDFMSDRVDNLRSAGSMTSSPSLGARLSESAGMAKGFWAGLRSKF